MDHSPSGKAQVAAPSIVAIELSWLRLCRIGTAQPAASIGFEQAGEVNQFHLPTPLVGCLHGQLTPIRRQAQSNGITT